MKAERIVVDTNIFISGVLSTSSTPARVVEHAVLYGQLLATADTQEELVTTLLASKFDRYVSRAKRESLLMSLSPLLEVVATVQIVRACRDPRDDRFLEAAINGHADILVTGDKDLLAMNPFRGIPIVTPAEYLARTEANKE